MYGGKLIFCAVCSAGGSIGSVDMDSTSSREGGGAEGSRDVS